MTNGDIARGPEVERGRGILSEADREYLRGEKDLSTQSERDARYRIRNRVQEALLDFHLLSKRLDSSDRRQIFEAFGPYELTNTFEFLYKGLYDTNEDFDTTNEMFEILAARAIADSLIDLDSDHVIEGVVVDIDVSRTTPELDELRSKLETGDESIEELRYMLRHEDVDRESIEEDLASRVIDKADIETTDDGDMSIRFNDYADLSAFLDITHLTDSR